MASAAAIPTLSEQLLIRLANELCEKPICEDWQRSRFEQAFLEYNQFLFLHKTYPDELIVPSADAAILWEQHRTFHTSYLSDCGALGLPCHGPMHYEELDDLTKDKAIINTRRHYERSFDAQCKWKF